MFDSELQGEVTMLPVNVPYLNLKKGFGVCYSCVSSLL